MSSTTREKLPKPLVPAGTDLRGEPLPRETFVQLAVAHFGVSEEEAWALVNEVADRMEGERDRCEVSH